MISKKVSSHEDDLMNISYVQKVREPSQENNNLFILHQLVAHNMHVNRIRMIKLLYAEGIMLQNASQDNLR